MPFFGRNSSVDRFSSDTFERTLTTSSFSPEFHWKVINVREENLFLRIWVESLLLLFVFSRFSHFSYMFFFHIQLRDDRRCFASVIRQLFRWYSAKITFQIDKLSENYTRIAVFSANFSFGMCFTSQTSKHGPTYLRLWRLYWMRCFQWMCKIARTTDSVRR
jgi:hypothetical protein